MLKIRNLLILFGVLLSPLAYAEVHVNIGINVPTYPHLVVVPGYPVYYAPSLRENYFFYDGLYWVYEDDYWFASEWYNGPWWVVEPEFVPVFILRIPVRYYYRPPAYFIGWRQDAPPRWGSHWGHDWERQRRGWDRWDHRYIPQPAPPPLYQRQFSGNRYPQQINQQQELQERNYRYQPRDPVVQRQYKERSVPVAPVQQDRQRLPEDRNTRLQDIQRVPEVNRNPRQEDVQRMPDSRNVRQQDNRRPETPQPDVQIAPPLPQSRQDGRVNVWRTNPANPPQQRPEMQNRNQEQQQQPRELSHGQQKQKNHGQQSDKDQGEARWSQERGHERN